MFNTLGRQLQVSSSLEPKKARVYSCGPTVYAYQHIGNLRAYVFADTLRRVLEWKGYEVTRSSTSLTSATSRSQHSRNQQADQPADEERLHSRDTFAEPSRVRRHEAPPRVDPTATCRRTILLRLRA
jgi:hypothetical protein